ncbi:mevalonate kinase [Companilactobacillus ginsenosidimutans]|uniref:Mevalonate kinase n=2 Tax=Companilactobacillus ginsenosidimutans TaxID=1007676 RepID=A0A0H4QNN2_9LACO|nr:mevalonate kinase [Companilactobacillus ginsenosidimutans]
MIMMGEHAVVYGYPAIALPLVSIPAIVRIKESKEKTLSSNYFVGKISELPESLSGVKYLIDVLDNEMNQHKINYSISIDSGLPIERGLGSSAAIGAAITKAFFDFFKRPLNESKLLEHINKSETVTHGKASGLDAQTVISDFPIKFSKGNSAEHFSFKSDGFIVIADSGIKGKTKQTVGDVRKMYDSDKDTVGQELKDLGTHTDVAVTALKTNNLKRLGEVFTDANSILSKLNLSVPKVDQLIDAANSAGSLGSKITGGGRGGCIICVARNLTSAQMIQKALLKNGAEQTWIQPLAIYENEETDID